MSALLRAQRELSLADGRGRQGRNKQHAAGQTVCVLLHFPLVEIAFSLISRFPCMNLVKRYWFFELIFIQQSSEVIIGWIVCVLMQPCLDIFQYKTFNDTFCCFFIALTFSRIRLHA